MRKSLHRIRVLTTDDASPDSMTTRWKLRSEHANRASAWTAASYLVRVRAYRHVKIVEERIFSNKH